MDTPYVTHIEERVHSTQDFARTQHELARNGKPTLVIAHRQDSGRGRHGNPWWSPTRAMFASLAVTAPDIEAVTLVPLVAGLAAHDAIESQLGVTTALKWPNDVLIAETKVGGILVERGNGTMVIGGGINLWWPDAPSGAGALLDHDPGAAAAVDLAQDWAQRLLEGLRDLPTSFDRTRYVAVCSSIGRTITWQPAGTGKAIGITADGGLIVATETGQSTLHAGEVSHVRPATMPADDRGST